ncbi:hypothetical protein FRC01_009392 [Tulasnella sp. 417]|nr:hypothetical protein FRC01_009392 [Tulasnella sp. 417]
MLSSSLHFTIATCFSRSSARMEVLQGRSKRQKGYGIEVSEKEEIGVLTSLALVRKIVADLEAVRNSGASGLTVYFTKEAHIHALVN